MCSSDLPLFGVSGVVKGHRPLGPAEHLFLGVPQDMWVRGQHLSWTGHAYPLYRPGLIFNSSPRLVARTRPRPGPCTQQVVSLQLSDLSSVLQASLPGHPAGHQVQIQGAVLRV